MEKGANVVSLGVGQLVIGVLSVILSVLAGVWFLLQHEIGQVDADVREVGSKVEELRDHVREDIGKVDGNVDALREHVREDIGKVDGNVDALRTDVTKIAKDVGYLRGRMDERDVQQAAD